MEEEQQRSGPDNIVGGEGGGGTGGESRLTPVNALIVPISRFNITRYMGTAKRVNPQGGSVNSDLWMAEVRGICS